MEKNIFFADCGIREPWIVLNSECELKPEQKPSLFPIVYHIKTTQFEILPVLDLSRKDEVWGYEIAPNIIMAKENYRCNHPEIFSLAAKFRRNNKLGRLVPITQLEALLNRNFYVKIQEMTTFLNENGIKASERGEIYSSTNINGMYIWTFALADGRRYSAYKDEDYEQRLVVTF